jgi:hypothetical protein
MTKNPVVENLPSEEQELVEILKQIIDIIGAIYDQQNNPDHPGGNLYPHDITREEFSQAAIKDPELNRFDTVVERVSASDYRAITYREKYEAYYQKIISLLKQALDLSFDSSFRVYIKAIIACLEEGSQEAYRHMMSAWVKTKDYHINFAFSYDELYVDRLMGLKGSFDAALFIEDKKLTPLIKKPLQIRDQFVKSLHLPGDPIYFPNHASSVYHTIYQKGMSSEMMARAWNAPDDMQARQEVGARQIVIKETITDLFEKELQSLVKKIFVLDEGYEREHFYNGIFWGIALHEASHNIANYKNQRQLEKYSSVLEELKSYILPMIWIFMCRDKKNCKLTEAKATVCVYLASSIVSALLGENIKARECYTTATYVHLNLLLEKGALEIINNKFKINFSRIVSVNQEIFQEILPILERGNYSRAQQFIDCYNYNDKFSKILDTARKLVKTNG